MSEAQYLCNWSPVGKQYFSTKTANINVQNAIALLLIMPLHNYAVFHKKKPFFVFSYFTQVMIDLHKIFTSCSWKNTNSKYCNKIWQL